MEVVAKRRKKKYDLLRKNGFDSYEATRYKNLSMKKVIALIKTRREVVKTKNESIRKEHLIWQKKR